MALVLVLLKGIAVTIGVAIGIVIVSWVLVRKPSGLLAMSLLIFQNHIDDLTNAVLIKKKGRPNEWSLASDGKLPSTTIIMVNEVNGG